MQIRRLVGAVTLAGWTAASLATTAGPAAAHAAQQLASTAPEDSPCTFTVDGRDTTGIDTPAEARAAVPLGRDGGLTVEARMDPPVEDASLGTVLGPITVEVLEFEAPDADGLRAVRAALPAREISALGKGIYELRLVADGCDRRALVVIGEGGPWRSVVGLVATGLTGGAAALGGLTSWRAAAVRGGSSLGHSALVGVPMGFGAAMMVQQAGLYPLDTAAMVCGIAGGAAVSAAVWQGCTLVHDATSPAVVDGRPAPPPFAPPSAAVATTTSAAARTLAAESASRRHAQADPRGGGHTDRGGSTASVGDDDTQHGTRKARAFGGRSRATPIAAGRGGTLPPSATDARSRGLDDDPVPEESPDAPAPVTPDSAAPADVEPVGDDTDGEVPGDAEAARPAAPTEDEPTAEVEPDTAPDVAEDAADPTSGSGTGADAGASTEVTVEADDEDEPTAGEPTSRAGVVIDAAALAAQGIIGLATTSALIAARRAAARRTAARADAVAAGEAVPFGAVGGDPYWFHTPAAAAVYPLDGSERVVGQLEPGTWYRAVATYEGWVHFVHEEDGTEGFVAESAVERAESD